MDKRLLLVASVLVSFLLCGPSPAVESPEQHEQHLRAASALLHDKNYTQAYQSFHAMATHGCLTSQCIIGLMHEHGVGVPKNGKQALSWFKKAASHNLAEAQYELGKMYAEGRAIERDPQQARYWLTSAANNGIAEAKSELTNLIDTPIQDNAPVQNNPVANGLQNIEHAWQGYADVANELKALDAEAANK